jgi:hypothetical protein
LGTHKTQRTDLGGQSGRSSDLTSGGSEVDDLYATNEKPSAVSFLVMRVWPRAGFGSREKRSRSMQSGTKPW